MTSITVQDHGGHGRYSLHTEGTFDYRGSVRRAEKGGGYIVNLDGDEWRMRHMPKVDRWADLGDAIAATKP